MCNIWLKSYSNIQRKKIMLFEEKCIALLSMISTIYDTFMAPKVNGFIGISESIKL